ncbi:MAG: methyltransferase regulatory domain-containing protein, partial [Prochlorotrichaceae cyanobacterium]
AHPTIGQDLADMEEESRIYLAHEYFNQNSQPFYHSEIVEHLAAAKLTFATSADLDDQFYNLALDEKQLQFLEEIPNRSLQETIRDFFFNSRFRRDLFVKGGIKLTPLEQIEWISKMRFVLLASPDEIRYEVQLAGRSIQLDPGIYTPLIVALGDHPQTLRNMMKQPDLARMGFASLFQALKILITLGYVAPALSADGGNDRAETIANFNMAVLQRARFGLETPILASPITGSGVEVSRTEQLFLLALSRGVDPVSFTWTILEVQGEKLIKADQVLESPEENQVELKQQFEEFERVRLPLLKRLGIV